MEMALLVFVALACIDMFLINAQPRNLRCFQQLRQYLLWTHITFLRLATTINVSMQSSNTKQ
eukprot:1685225-Ditylum_brightwellii.AAC.1